jgi:hypothetical protein
MTIHSFILLGLLQQIAQIWLYALGTCLLSREES